MQRAVLFFVCLILANNFLWASSIIYNKNHLLVTGFPMEKPATLEAIYKEAQKKQWNIIEYDEKTDTYLLKTSLWIGSLNDSTAFFHRRHHTSIIL